MRDLEIRGLGGRRPAPRAPTAHCTHARTGAAPAGLDLFIGLLDPAARIARFRTLPRCRRQEGRRSAARPAPLPALCGRHPALGPAPAPPRGPFPVAAPASCEVHSRAEELVGLEMQTSQFRLSASCPPPPLDGGGGFSSFPRLVLHCTTRSFREMHLCTCFSCSQPPCVTSTFTTAPAVCRRGAQTHRRPRGRSPRAWPQSRSHRCDRSGGIQWASPRSRGAARCRGLQR